MIFPFAEAFVNWGMGAEYRLRTECAGKADLRAWDGVNEERGLIQGSAKPRQDRLMA